MLPLVKRYIYQYPRYPSYGDKRNDEGFVGPCGSTNSFNFVQTWNKRLISRMSMMLLQHTYFVWVMDWDSGPWRSSCLQQPKSISSMCNSEHTTARHPPQTTQEPAQARRGRQCTPSPSRTGPRSGSRSASQTSSSPESAPCCPSWVGMEGTPGSSKSGKQKLLQQHTTGSQKWYLLPGTPYWGWLTLSKYISNKR